MFSSIARSSMRFVSRCEITLLRTRCKNIHCANCSAAILRALSLGSSIVHPPNERKRASGFLASPFGSTHSHVRWRSAGSLANSRIFTVTEVTGQSAILRASVAQNHKPMRRVHRGRDRRQSRRTALLLALTSPNNSRNDSCEHETRAKQRQ